MTADFWIALPNYLDYSFPSFLGFAHLVQEIGGGKESNPTGGDASHFPERSKKKKERP